MSELIFHVVADDTIYLVEGDISVDLNTIELMIGTTVMCISAVQFDSSHVYGKL